HHKVRILDEAVEEAVRLSQRYIPDRQLPDKAISLIDTACARVALSQSTTPAQLEDSRREIDKLKLARKSLEREENLGIGHKAQIADIDERLAREETRCQELSAQWEKEKAIAAKVDGVRAVLEKIGAPADPAAPAAPPADAEKARAELVSLSGELAKVQGETPLVHPFVNGAVVAEVISGWTGIPLGKMVRNEVENILKLADTLKKRVVGQDHAMDILAERLQTNRAGLSDPRLPIGVFMLVGPSGVGKTETAITLAELMFGGETSLTVINMSEYKSDMMVSRLTGPAPGLVGYGKGGVLTEAVRRKPSSLVLLDAIEKANPAVHDLFFQVFDKGSLTDEKGLETDFKNTIILLTSNAGTDLILKLCADPDTRPDSNALRDAIRPELLKSFKDAFLGRITVVPYFPLTADVLRKIIRLKLGRVADRMKESYRAPFTYDDAVVTAILGRCNEAESGARIVDKIINTTLLPEISRRLLAAVAEGGTVTGVRLGAGKAEGCLYEIEVDTVAGA
ncbi:MAG: AAA family ATPase, partial [Planctomycetota bacterium]